MISERASVPAADALRLRWLTRIEIPYAELLFLAIVFGVGTQIVGLLGDYNASHQHPEYITGFFPRVLQHGSGLNPEDLIAGLDVHRSDGLPRPRFLSYELTDLNVRLRLLWMQYFQPHPSMNVSWLLQIISIPLLYRAVVNMTGRTAAGIMAIAIYIASAGFLSGFTLLFHPAKPLASFMLIAVLLIGSELTKGGRRLLIDAPRRLTTVLLLTLFLASISDELGAVSYVVAVVVFWQLFVPVHWAKPDIRRAARSVGLLSIPILGFVALVVVATIVDKYVYDYSFRVFDMFLGAGSTLPVGLQLVWMTIEASLGASLATGELITTVALTVAVAVVVLIAAIRSALVRSLSLAIGLYFVMALYLAAKSADVQGQYYYGCVFSVLFAVLLSVASAELIKACTGAGPKLFALRTATSLGLVTLTFFLTNVGWQQFQSLNSGWENGNTHITYGMLQRRYPGLTEVGTSTAEVADLWERWRAGEDIVHTYRGSYLNVWLLNEMDQRTSCC